MDNRLEKYLKEIDKHLRFLPISEKTDILSELKSSFVDMAHDGMNSEQIIEKMGSAKELAAEYLVDAIVKANGFTWKGFWMAFGFYSLASLTWLSVIPTLASLAFSFLLSSIVSVLAGIVVAFKPFASFYLSEFIVFNIFGYKPEGLAAFVIGIVLAIIFFLLGILFWKLTVITIRKLGDGRYKLRHMA